MFKHITRPSDSVTLHDNPLCRPPSISGSYSEICSKTKLGKKVIISRQANNPSEMEGYGSWAGGAIAPDDNSGRIRNTSTGAINA